MPSQSTNDRAAAGNGFETKAIYLLGLLVFLGAATIWAYMTLAAGKEAPREILLILGFGVAFIRDFLTETRMAKRLDFYEREIIQNMVIQQNSEQPVATRQERHRD